MFLHTTRMLSFHLFVSLITLFLGLRPDRDCSLCLDQRTPGLRAEPPRRFGVTRLRVDVLPARLAALAGPGRHHEEAEVPAHSAQETEHRAHRAV